MKPFKSQLHGLQGPDGQREEVGGKAWTQSSFHPTLSWGGFGALTKGEAANGCSFKRTM